LKGDGLMAYDVSIPADNLAIPEIPKAIRDKGVDLKELIDTHANQTSGSHVASAIICTPTGDISATNVQSAIAELAAEKVNSSDVATTATASKIVRRDASGKVVGGITGNAVTTGNLKSWQASQAVTLGEVRYPANLPSYTYVECTVAGTTGTTEPTWTGVGTTVTDGTITWIIRDKRVATDSSDNSTKLSTTAWIKNSIQSLVSGCIATVATAAGFSYSLTTNGYIKFPSWLAGIMFQWGKYTGLTRDANNTLSFPTTFLTNCLIVTGNLTDASSNLGAWGDTIGFTKVSTSQFIASLGHYGSASTANVFMLAIGY
jgi:hypothetical protein